MRRSRISRSRRLPPGRARRWKRPGSLRPRAWTSLRPLPRRRLARCPGPAIAVTPEPLEPVIRRSPAMADHGTVEYATATGNDYPAHEQTYESFVKYAFDGSIHVINLLLGLTVGGVLGHWFMAIPVFLLAIIGLIAALGSGSKTPSYVAFALSFLI